MKLLFVHDHIFRCVNDEMYSTGNLSDDVLSRYTANVESMTVVSRIKTENQFDGKWSKIVNKKVEIKGSRGLINSKLGSEIAKCDKMIVRMPSFLGSQALLLNKYYKKPTYIELVGCPWDALRFHGKFGRLIAPIQYLITKHEVHKAKYVLYVTEEFLQKRYPTKGKTIGCSDVALSDISREILIKRIEKINHNDSKLVLGTTAAIDVKYKGQENVIKAIAILKKQGITNIEYELVGNGNSDYLKKIAIDFGVEDSIHFLGGMPHDEVFNWLDKIDIYIQPSLTEGLPRALIEAQSRALPCIGSSVGEIPKLLSGKNIYHINKDMPQEIAYILTSMNKDKMLELAKLNFEISMKYEKMYLAQKREAFLYDFLNS